MITIHTYLAESGYTMWSSPLCQRECLAPLPARLWLKRCALPFGRSGSACWWALEGVHLVQSTTFDWATSWSACIQGKAEESSNMMLESQSTMADLCAPVR